MLPKERVLTALRRQEPDRVPWIELEVEQKVYDDIFHRSHVPTEKPLGLYNRDAAEEKEFARRVGKDNILYSLRPPVFCDFHRNPDGTFSYGQGLICSRDDLKKMVFPNLEDRTFYKPAQEFVKEKEEFAALATTRLGFAATYLSIGMMNFFELLYEDLDFVLEVMARYTRWLCRVMEMASNIGFDVVSASDDMAMKSGHMISPQMIAEHFIPPMKKVARSIGTPWITHSDGDMLPMMDIWLKFGQDGIHPLEPEAMDIRQVKQAYGSRVCLIGNVDVDLLSNGNPLQIEKCVHDLIRDVAPNGGYLLSSGNSLTSYAKAENVLAMGRALKKYGRYPISMKELNLEP